MRSYRNVEFILAICCSYLIVILSSILSSGTWSSVESSPLASFLSVRRQKCALAGESPLDGALYQTRRILPHNISAQDMLHFMKEKLKNKKKYIPRGPKLPGPPRGPGYDPSYGYEPYWIGGEWTLEQASEITEPPKTSTNDANDTNDTNDTTAAVGDSYCGYECNEMYREYGEVCGEDAEGNQETFDNYCYMLAIDCEHIKGWQMVHRGKCEWTLQTYNWENARQQHGLHLKLVNEFYEKFSRPIGSAVSVTEAWTYKQTFQDNG